MPNKLPLPLEPVDAVSITTLVDNFVDVLMLDDGPAKRMGLPTAATPRVPAAFLETGEIADAPLAEHGFSTLVTVSKGGREHRLLFDAGMTPGGLAENMRRLQLSPKDIEAVVLSHGHFDHTTGLDGFAKAVGRANLPAIIHPEFWSRRRIIIPGRDPFELPSTSRSGLLGAGFEIIEDRQPSFLFQNSVLITGEVDRTTDFEKGMPIHQAFREGAWQLDPLILDDQALVVNVRDKGLVVLTGCGHAGIINILRYARKLTGMDYIAFAMGGLHLNGPIFEPIIPAVCDALAEIAPNYVVPAHCTGWKAVHAISARFPGVYLQNSVGTRFEL
ncbi:MAG TPA: MBL fold metallo-hydrolase [Dehalococcoidia bacterium]|nr:MBL fold metallo-hydrolase [Dehalococcoidia bacterium]